MSEQTGMPASTLHSALGLVTGGDMLSDEVEYLSSDLVVVDEASMIDMRLANALFERLRPNAHLILVGDPDQLPSVGAGNVLRELMRSEQVPTAVLDSVFRQASNSNINLNAQLINHNDTHLLYGDDFIMYGAENAEQAAELVIKTYLEEINKYGIENVQILTPFRKRGCTAANILNERIRDVVNPARDGIDEIKSGNRIYRVGDRIIQTCNRENVSNGDVGIITDIDRAGDETKVRIHFLDGQDLEYTMEMMEDLDSSYCLTIHKAQGSEYACVIVPLLRENYIMLRRNLIYTAITRAKKKVVLIGQKQAVYTAIHKNDVDRRNTVLADRIIAYYAREKKRIAG